MSGTEPEAGNELDDLAEGRGPAYPSISLDKAVERADLVRAANLARTSLPTSGFYKIWGFKAASGTARRQLAAMKYYGLLESIGSGKERKARLTDLALKIILDKVPDSPARAAAIKEAALKPPIFVKLLDAFPFGIGTDSGFETFLTLSCGYNEESANKVMGVFRDTIRFAGLDKPANMTGDREADPSLGKADERKKNELLQEVEIGDLVQVEIGGALQLPQAVKVRAIKDHEGAKWVFVEGHETGVPMEQVIVEQKGGVGVKADQKPPTLPLSDLTPPKGTRREVFALDEGDVVLTFPESLSATSFEDLDAYLKVFISKMRRRAKEAKKES